MQFSGIAQSNLNLRLRFLRMCGSKDVQTPSKHAPSPPLPRRLRKQPRAAASQATQRRPAARKRKQQPSPAFAAELGEEDAADEDEDEEVEHESASSWGARFMLFRVLLSIVSIVGAAPRWAHLADSTLLQPSVREPKEEPHDLKPGSDSRPPSGRTPLLSLCAPSRLGQTARWRRGRGRLRSAARAR